MIKLSVVIPSYKDPLLWKTINCLLETSELGDQLEIIAVWDGYYPSADVIILDPRVRYVHLGRNRGMREAINAGISVARGEYIMRTDEHCLFSQGFDKAMTDACQPNWIMTARRYFLDPKKWGIMEELGYVDYEKLAVREGVKFEGQRWSSRKRKRKDILIDETMAMQGSVWVMPKAWWEKVIVKLQTEGYGPLTQDSHEMVFKTWQAGGKLMLHKGVWFAHKHISFSRTHQHGTVENPANIKRSGEYALEVWQDYYNKEIKPKWGL